ncbi:MAG: cob(I)yrinic acid a,c-diamide adenosyltransferase [bacterium]|nr:cob(I)yrinic acid a,c-diamide adenosyltransferase [bacterium]
MPHLSKGLIQVYTGAGKGKTTTAIGQAIRAAGQGLRVCIFQFLKSEPTGEQKILDQLEGIKIVQSDYRCLHPKNEIQIKRLKDASRRLLDKACNSMEEYDIIILDEINVALHLSLLETQDVLKLFNNKPGNLELILTGRDCPKEILEVADLVTEMKRIKHYYDKGIEAREGIEY